MTFMLNNTAAVAAAAEVYEKNQVQSQEETYLNCERRSARKKATTFRSNRVKKEANLRVREKAGRKSELVNCCF